MVNVQIVIHFADKNCSRRLFSSEERFNSDEALFEYKRGKVHIPCI